jgi:hypothetical protein
MRVPSTQPLLRRPLSTLLTCAGGADAISLAGPILMRSIGALFNPANEPAYFTSQVFFSERLRFADFRPSGHTKHAAAILLLRSAPISVRRRIFWSTSHRAHQNGCFTSALK